MAYEDERYKREDGSTAIYRHYFIDWLDEKRIYRWVLQNAHRAEGDNLYGQRIWLVENSLYELNILPRNKGRTELGSSRDGELDRVYGIVRDALIHIERMTGPTDTNDDDEPIGPPPAPSDNTKEPKWIQELVSTEGVERLEATEIKC